MHRTWEYACKLNDQTPEHCFPEILVLMASIACTIVCHTNSPRNRRNTSWHSHHNYFVNGPRCCQPIILGRLAVGGPTSMNCLQCAYHHVECFALINAGSPARVVQGWEQLCTGTCSSSSLFVFRLQIYDTCTFFLARPFFKCKRAA